MPNANPKKLSNHETLRRIQKDLLLAWLEPAAAYLEKRGFTLPDHNQLSLGLDLRIAGRVMGNGVFGRRVDYELLGQIFREPTPDMPAYLVESLYLIQGMAHPQGM